MYGGYHLSSPYPYSGEKVSTGSYIFWTYTCPAKKQPICGTEKNTCASGSSRCDDDDGSDNKWICYSDDDINLTVTCTGYTYYDRDTWSSATSPRNYSTDNKCTYAESYYQVWTCNTGNVWKKTAKEIISSSYCNSYHVSNLQQCINYSFSNINWCVYVYTTCGEQYHVNPGIKWWSCPTSYTITYDANGWTWAPDKWTKEHSKPFTLSNVEPKRAWYIFKWRSTNKTATSPTYQTGWTISAATNNNVTLYAVRQPYTYNVTLYENRWDRQNAVYYTNLTGIYTIEAEMKDGRKIYKTNLIPMFKCHSDFFYSFWEVKSCWIHKWYNMLNSWVTLKQWSYIDSDYGYGQIKWDKNSYRYTFQDSSSSYPTTNHEFIFDGWYTTPQTWMEIYGVDPKSFILTRDIPLLGNPSENEAKIEEIHRTGIPINRKVSQESPWTWTMLKNGDSLELFAHYKYNKGVLVAGYFWKNNSDKADGNWKDIYDNTKETRSRWTIRNTVPGNTNCLDYQDKDCFGNMATISYAKNTNKWGDWISTSTESFSKYDNAVRCRLDDNVQDSLGSGARWLNYMQGAYDDHKNDKKSQWHIKGCYFVVSHENYQYNPTFDWEPVVWWGVVWWFAGVGTVALLSQVAIVNSRNPAWWIIWWGVAIWALIWWLTNRDEPTYQPYIISNGAWFSLRDDEKHYSYWKWSIQDLYKNAWITAQKGWMDYLQDMISDYRYKYNLR